MRSHYGPGCAGCISCLMMMLVIFWPIVFFHGWLRWVAWAAWLVLMIGVPAAIGFGQEMRGQREEERHEEDWSVPGPRDWQPPPDR